jgi:hypothetical protein
MQRGGGGVKFCMPHWEQLREAIGARGLSGLISKGGEQATKRVTAELSGASERETFDPLMAANFAIWSRALDVGGLYLMGTDPEGKEYCPLCELDKQAKNPDGSAPDPPASTQWIEGCSDAQRDHAVELGLVPRES